MTKGHVYFIGAGPGDPELITVKGRKTIEKADVIVYAGSLVPREMLGDVRKKVVYDSSRLSLGEITDIMVRQASKGKVVARVHDGDPSLFGALREQILALEERGVPYAVIPGISALFAAAARMKVELTIPPSTQTVIITRVPGRTGGGRFEALKHLASSKSTLVFYLSIAYIQKLVTELKKYLPEDTPVAVIYRVTWPDEAIIRGNLADILNKVKPLRLKAHSLVIVGSALDQSQERLAHFKSKLYDPKFSHSYRRSAA